MESEINKILTVEDIKKSLQVFGIIDYLVFIIMLSICAITGYYFGFIKKTKIKSSIQNLEIKSNIEELNYLMGDKNMKILPVSLSLIASYLSGMAILGNATEVYVYGTQMAFSLIPLVFCAIMAWFVFLPIFCDLQLTSLYEYLELRYSRRLRLFGSMINIIGITLWLSIAVYIPGLVFNQMTGIDVHTITPIICIVGIFYSGVGGLKAVVWTDVYQSVIVLGAVLIVSIKGTIDVGGIIEVFRRNYEGDRLEYPEMTFDPTIRLSMFSAIIGSGFFWLQDACLGQVVVQRMLSVPTLKESRKVLILFLVGVTILILCCTYNGLLIYATYYNCDPLSTSLVNVKDQLLPLLVIQVLGHIPGLSGIFVAGIMSPALSTLSTGLNSLSAIFLEDILKPCLKSPLNYQQTRIIMRLSVVIFGVICYLLVSVIEKLGMILQLALTLSSVLNGSILGLYLMGFFMPWINEKSALAGGISSFSIMCWISINAQIEMSTGEFVVVEKPVTTDGCNYIFNVTQSQPETISSDSPKSIYHISFMLYTLLGTLICIFSAQLTTLIYGRINSKDWNRKVIAPFLRKYIPPSNDKENHKVTNSEMNAFIPTELNK